MSRLKDAGVVIRPHEELLALAVEIRISVELLALRKCLEDLRLWVIPGSQGVAKIKALFVPSLTELGNLYARIRERSVPGAEVLEWSSGGIVASSELEICQYSSEVVTMVDRAG